MNDHSYLTTSIPYVNAAPHLGHALEFVQADVLARHRRAQGRPVRLLSGTDDHAVKNVLAATRAGVDPAAFVAGNAAAFVRLRDLLDLSFDDFIQTSTDPRHRPGVQRLWRASAERGDFYRRSYSGRYCLGCEQFYSDDELVNGLCPEHGTPVETVAEDNWFFRLSAYAGEIERLIRQQVVRIEPTERRNEVLAFLGRGVEDISVSRPAERARGWGIAVPSDDTQVVYVWWDALCNYVTALDYGGDQRAYREWWVESAERLHVVGKGITRFHAVYWLALLLSAGQPLPTTIFVHDYLTLGGAKISKSSGLTLSPDGLVDRYGTDALRWWLVSDVARVGDTDFTADRLVQRYQQDLAGGIGNLVNRTCALVHRFRQGQVQPERADRVGSLVGAVAGLADLIEADLARFDLRSASGRLTGVVAEANRYLEAERPWTLGRDEARGGPSDPRLDEVLATAVVSCRVLAREFAPFIPGGARRLQEQLGSDGRVLAPAPVFGPLLGT
ncbi:MAG: methionine--tRNA ligase [Propionibacteriaceae bacterium]